MKFSIISIFPESFESYFSSSMINRARLKKLVRVDFLNPRRFSENIRGKIDDRPYGGGPGMVLEAEPIVKAVDFVSKRLRKKPKIILFSPSGRQFTQKMALKIAKNFENIILICGHYEGVDERVCKITKAEKISIGPYVLTGGELPAMIMVDAVSRHIEGVLGKKESLEHNRFENKNFFEVKNETAFLSGCPVYTRPETIKWKGKKYRVPKVLLSGNHKKIEEWRKKHIPGIKH